MRGSFLSLSWHLSKSLQNSQQNTTFKISVYEGKWVHDIYIICPGYFVFELSVQLFSTFNFSMSLLLTDMWIIVMSHIHYSNHKNNQVFSSSNNANCILIRSYSFTCSNSNTPLISKNLTQSASAHKFLFFWPRFII